MFNTATSASMLRRQYTPAKIMLRATEIIRRPNDRLDNLGILHGWAKPGSTAYDLGILARFRPTDDAIWDEAIAQLKVAGWRNLLVFSEQQLMYEMFSVQDVIEAAARRL